MDLAAKSAQYDLAPLVAPRLLSALVGPIESATLALARFDERLLRAEPTLAEGQRARAHFSDAQACVALAGGLAPMEDLVLHDANMATRIATLDVVRAASYLDLRRSIAQREPGSLRNAGQLERLLGLNVERAGGDEPVATTPRARSPALPLFANDDSDEDDWREEEADDDDTPADEAPESAASAFPEIDAIIAHAGRTLEAYGDLESETGRKALRLASRDSEEAERLTQWLVVAEATRRCPGVLAAAIALDAWLWIEPAPSRSEAGLLFAANILRQRGIARCHLPTLALGLRSGRFRWRRSLDSERRLTGLIDAIQSAARLADSDLDRLTLARQLMLKKCEGKSKNSRLTQLVDLFVASPLVTIAMVATALDISPQGVEALLKDLGSSLPREMTGRKRYRAWGIV